MNGLSVTTNLEPIEALDQADWAKWSELRAANPLLGSPYFHPDYARLIGELRPDVRIAIARDQGEAMGFFPIQGDRFVRPVGAPMSDYHAIIQGPETNLTYASLMSGTKAGALHFWASLDAHHHDAAHVQTHVESAALMVEGSGEDWRAGRDGSYRRHLKSNRRRIRKAAEEIGEPRFVWQSRDIDVFASLIDWKVRKFEDTGKYNVLSADWTMALIRKLWERPATSTLRGDMHALYFGDRLAAVDLGLTDGHIFHSWIVAYDGELHSYAPGIQLLEAMIDAAPELGYGGIDMGTGLDGYKRHYATHSQIASAGFVPISGPAAGLSRIYGAAERFGTQKMGDLPGKLRRRYSQIAACEDDFSGRARAMMSAVNSHIHSAS